MYYFVCSFPRKTFHCKVCRSEEIEIYEHEQSSNNLLQFSLTLLYNVCKEIIQISYIESYNHYNWQRHNLLSPFFFRKDTFFVLINQFCVMSPLGLTSKTTKIKYLPLEVLCFWLCRFFSCREHWRPNLRSRQLGACLYSSSHSHSPSRNYFINPVWFLSRMSSDVT